MSDPRRGNPLQRLPLPAFFAFVVLLWVTLQTVFSTEPVGVISISSHVLGGLVFATVTTVGIGLRRRRLGGTEASIAYARAVRTGVLQEGVETTGWSAELDRSERRLHRDRWIIRIGGLLPFGLGIWVATDPDGRVLGILVAAAMVAGWVCTEIATPRAFARLERIRAALPR